MNYSSTSSASSPPTTLLPLPLLGHNLRPQHLLDDPQILLLPAHDLLDLAQVHVQLGDLALVEAPRVLDLFLDVEAGADVDEHARRAGQLAGDVQRCGERDEDLGSFLPRRHPLLYAPYAVPEARLRLPQPLVRLREVLELLRQARLQLRELLRRERREVDLLPLLRHRGERRGEGRGGRGGGKGPNWLREKATG